MSPVDVSPRVSHFQLALWGDAADPESASPEFQIYAGVSGFSNHLAFLASMWREFSDSDTYAKGPGSTVTKVALMAVYIISGNNRNRPAWPATRDRIATGPVIIWRRQIGMHSGAWHGIRDVSSQQIADEWIRDDVDPRSIAARTIARMMVESHEAVVDRDATGTASPFWGWPSLRAGAPWWNTEGAMIGIRSITISANADGIGFDRTATGSGTVSQYHHPERFANINNCPEKFLLWFHHVPWGRPLKSKRTVWDELALHYQRGRGLGQEQTR